MTIDRAKNSAALSAGSAGPDDAAASILAVLAERLPGTSVSPTDAARHLAAACGATGPDGWRRHLGAIRQAARHLAQTGAIDILRKGKVIDPAAVRGVIRLRLPASTAQNPEEP